MRCLRFTLKSIVRFFWGYGFLPIGFASHTVDSCDISIAKRLLNNPDSWFDQQNILDYEEAFAIWNGSKGCYSFMGGRVALSAAISALNLKFGDEVIIPNYTCVVVANAFLFEGVTVRYCDIELDTYGPSIDSIKKNFTGKTRAILVQHSYGIVCRDLMKILDFARSKNLLVIEDCCHATGASLDKVKVGNFGDVGIYSSEQSKIFSTFNGGLAVSNNEEILFNLSKFQTSAPYPSSDRIHKLIENFIYSYHINSNPLRFFFSELYRFKYESIFIQSTTNEEIAGFKPNVYGERMPSALATLGLKQLEKIDLYNDQRRKAGNYWMEVCGDMGFAVPSILKGSSAVYLRFPVRVPLGRKNDSKWIRKKFRVDHGVWFSGELHPKSNPLESCPNSRIAVETCINLPTLI
jgi:dTDP-4-amino-4,6-dideoxygalactose transaminase